ncbi:MBL fold metallo-hydrolase [Arthrobacter psychrochitiniphilus]|uniref:MBL fold metallo-hydrolase n=1 Tax=Arthrobacter psychrochitiniphilus TaxID=291045 RepID=UPI003F7C983A
MRELKCGALQLQESFGANGYVIPLENSYAVVDPGMWFGAKAVITELATAGILGSVEHILLTHYDLDHAGAAQALATETGATLWIGQADADILTGRRPAGTFVRRITSSLFRPKIPEDTAYIDKDPGFPATIAAVPTPGHTPGHFAFVWERTLLCGDSARVNADGTLRDFMHALNTDSQQARVTRQQLTTVDVDWVCPGHGKVTQRRR